MAQYVWILIVIVSMWLSYYLLTRPGKPITHKRNRVINRPIGVSELYYVEMYLGIHGILREEDCIKYKFRGWTSDLPIDLLFELDKVRYNLILSHISNPSYNNKSIGNRANWKIVDRNFKLDLIRKNGNADWVRGIEIKGHGDVNYLHFVELNYFRKNYDNILARQLMVTN